MGKVVRDPKTGRTYLNVPAEPVPGGPKPCMPFVYMDVRVRPAGEVELAPARAVGDAPDDGMDVENRLTCSSGEPVTDVSRVSASAVAAECAVAWGSGRLSREPGRFVWHPDVPIRSLTANGRDDPAAERVGPCPTDLHELLR